jgi:predicted transcriptional regulator of viral defense system
MTKNAPSAELGPIEAQFLIAVASRGSSVFTVETAHSYWKNPGQARAAVARLEKKGWLKRLERGKYLVVPLEAGPERMWVEDSLVMATILQEDSVAGYWTALNYWGMAGQISRTVFVQSSRRRSSSEKNILGIRFRFITVTSSKLYGFSVLRIGGSEVRVTDREKTIIDCLDRPDLAGGIKQIARTMHDQAPRLDWDRFDYYLERFPTGAVAKRAGYIVEATAVEIPDRSTRTARWRGLTKAGYVKLEPGWKSEGRIIRRWGIRDNVGLEQAGRRR